MAYHRNNTNLLLFLPFSSLSDYELEQEFQSTKNYYISLMKENFFYNAIKENKFLNKMKGQKDTSCEYYDSEEFIALNLNQHRFLNIFYLNISSLPKHAGELACFLCSLETTFDIIVLNEISRCSTSNVENLFSGFTFYVDFPLSNARGGVGIYMSNRLGSIVRKTDFEYNKTCNCATCETECVCLTFTCFDKSFNLLSVYRHPRGNKKHFIKDLGNSIAQLNNKSTTLLIGDTNIDLMKFDKNKDHNDYASMLFSNGFMPTITYPTRITPHSATLIDHIFIKSTQKDTDYRSGIQKYL